MKLEVIVGKGQSMDMQIWTQIFRGLHGDLYVVVQYTLEQESQTSALRQILDPSLLTEISAKLQPLTLHRSPKLSAEFISSRVGNDVLPPPGITQCCDAEVRNWKNWIHSHTLGLSENKTATLEICRSNLRRQAKPQNHMGHRCFKQIVQDMEGFETISLCHLVGGRSSFTQTFCQQLSA